MGLFVLSVPVCQSCVKRALVMSFSSAVALGMFIFLFSFHYIVLHLIYLTNNSFIARPGRATYSASKFGIEAVHESLSHEVKTLGIKVLIVEPGAFRTPFSSRIITPARLDNGFSEAYKGTAVEQMVVGSRQLTSIPDFVKGDPDKAARAIINATVTGYDYLRMPLGTDCVIALESKIADLQRDLEATRSIATSTDVD